MTKPILGMIALLALASQARADDLDCGSFPATSRWSCYEAASRAPKPDVAPRAVAPRPDVRPRKSRKPRHHYR